MNTYTSPLVNPKKRTIEFFLHNECASHVSLCGSFNHWAHDSLLMKPDKDGIWKIEIPMLPEGRYQYKFIIDDKIWTEDIENPYRVPDGVMGFNSILMI